MIQRHSARLLAASLFSLTLLAAFAVAAHEYTFGALHIDHPWTRPTSPGAPTAVGFLVVHNNGATPDRLIGAATPLADHVEIHRMSLAGGIMVMRPVPAGLAIPAKGVLTLAPGGYHLMIIAPRRPFVAGERIPLRLRFEHAGAVNVELAVDVQAPAGGSMPGMTMPGDTGAKR